MYINKKLDDITVRQLNERKEHHLWLPWYLTDMQKQFITAESIRSSGRKEKKTLTKLDNITIIITQNKDI